MPLVSGIFDQAAEGVRNHRPSAIHTMDAFFGGKRGVGVGEKRLFAGKVLDLLHGNALRAVPTLYEKAPISS
jgi:hypothetical protein